MVDHTLEPGTHVRITDDPVYPPPVPTDITGRVVAWEDGLADRIIRDREHNDLMYRVQVDESPEDVRVVSWERLVVIDD